jgi:hypothetical protein
MKRPSAMNLNFLNLTSNGFLTERSSFFGGKTPASA